jgi:hypothetical protein
MTDTRLSAEVPQALLPQTCFFARAAAYIVFALR